MPFIADIYPPSEKLEAAAALGLAMGSRKGKGFPGRKQYESIDVLARFSVTLQAAAWERNEESCLGLVIDPQGILSGAIRFELPPAMPPEQLPDNILEEDFIQLCRRIAKAAASSSTETAMYQGLIVEPEQVRLLLRDDDRCVPEAGLEKTVDPATVVAALKEKLEHYACATQAWSDLKQKVLAYRDRIAAKINEVAGEAKFHGESSLAELERQVEASVAARRREAEAAGKEARRQYRKQKEIIQSELSRFQQQYKETGNEYWRDKIKIEEQHLLENEKELAETINRLNEAESNFIKNEQERIRQFKEQNEQRLIGFEQRLKRLDSTVAALEKGLNKRLERLQEQHKKVANLSLSLPPAQCEKQYQVVFYAARFSGDRWQVFPPQVFGDRGIMGKVSDLVGDLSLPFRPAGKPVEVMAAKIQAFLPGHPLGDRLVGENLLQDPAFIKAAIDGLAELIDQGKISSKHAALFNEFKVE